VHCPTGCTQEAVLDALNTQGLWSSSGRKGEGDAYTPLKSTAAMQAQVCTLIQFAEAKQLPVDFLRGLGLQDMSYLGQPADRIPYFMPDGSEGPVQFRIA
jgi:hypothetical protein